MGSNKGSGWGKWDLHVHTPSSIVQEYGPDNETTWANFINDLEKLPEEFKVIGVNDYIFIDGYRRLREEKASGRLQNIELLLPVIELRLAMFGGTKNQLSRVNYHVIFSDQLDPEIIQQHFINALTQHFQLSPEHAGLEWNALPTRDSLADLGSKIIASVPSEKQAAFGPPIVEGFNNLNFELSKIESALKSHYLRDSYLTAIGKAEWADIKWSDNTIASKKKIINEADFVFTAAVSPATYDKARAALRAEKVGARLLDCSDAHRLSSSSDKDRIGNCFTWIKAEPTFLGLKHVVREFDARVFVGETPEKLLRLRNQPNDFIASIRIKRTANADPATENWFDSSLPISPDLVAIIGNKGGGKSALADIIGLTGETRNHEHFSFLTANRFRQDRNEKAKCFEATLTFESGEDFTRTLDSNPDDSTTERVKYIPQRYLEFVCNEVAALGETEFDREVKQVLFSHVPENEQLGFESLDEVLRSRTAEIDRAAGQIRARLHETNVEIVSLEDRLEPEYRASLESKLAAKQLALSQHAKLKPPEVQKPAASSATDNATHEAIAKLQATIAELTSSLRIKNQELDSLTKQTLALTKLAQRVKAAGEHIQSEKDEMRSDFHTFGLNVDSVIVASFNLEDTTAAIAKLSTSKAKVQSEVSPTAEGALPLKLRAVESEVARLKNQLAEPQRKFQDYLSKLSQWTARDADLRGSATAPNSVIGLQTQLAALDALPALANELRGKRTKLAKELYSKVEETIVACKSLYAPAQTFIASHPVIGDRNLLTFSATIEEGGFAKGFLDKLDQRTRGKFSGLTAGARTLTDMLREADFNSWPGVSKFLAEVAGTLNADNKHAQRQLRKEESLVGFYDFIFSFEYLRPHYSMKLAGKPLRALSPGERGTLLLVFYLIVDTSLLPLVIDQPEDNLDNQTIFSLLVPCIRAAKQRRQIILVTHSPNLAVVCDAEQIIYASYQADGTRINYVAGALEEPNTNSQVLTVLEGTRPAFDDRRRKYQPFQT